MRSVTWREAECRTVMGVLGCMLTCLCMMGCGRDAGEARRSSPAAEAKAPAGETAALRRRAEAFGDLLVRIQDMPELDAKKALERFIEPSPDGAKKIDQYYGDFSAASEKFRIVSQSVTSVRVNSNHLSAEVTYGTVAKTPDGREIPVEQRTQWKRVGNEWYRSIEDAEKKLNR